jgi:hypothetical protein
VAPALFPSPHILKRRQTGGLPDNNVPKLELGNEGINTMSAMITGQPHNLSAVAQSLNWSALVTAVATGALAILTFIYVWLTRKILKVQSDPYVILSIIHDYDRPSMLKLVVKNVGPGLAHDISFNFSRPIPEKAWGIDVEKAQTAEILTTGPLIDGIPMLGPGEERKFDWGQYGGLIHNLGGEPVTVECSFKKNNKRMSVVICKLDVRSFEKSLAIKTTNIRIVEALEEISKNLEKIVKEDQSTANDIAGNRKNPG